MRDLAIQEVLASCGWSGARVTPVTGDLSQRRYFRIARGQGETAILMDARDDAQSIEPFVKIARWLRASGLSAPEIYAESSQFLLLEDFGNQQLGDVLENTPQIYAECIDLLVHIRGLEPPDLVAPSAKELVKWTDLATWVPGVEKTAISAIQPVLETNLADFMNLQTVSLRDFHAENIMWLPNRSGIARFGLLDFQDAFLTHPVYDLVSFLTDARRSVSKETRTHGVATYAKATGDDPEVLKRAFAVFSVQRNLRILGIFSRAALRDGKSHHVPKMPRVYGYLAEALEHPVFDTCRDAFLAGFPPPHAEDFR